MDKLVLLLESPIFIHLRLQLLESSLKDNYTPLLSIINGLLTLLPPCDSYNQLRIRIQIISTYNQLAKMVSKHSDLTNQNSFTKILSENDFKTKTDQSLLFQQFLKVHTSMTNIASSRTRADATPM